MRRTLGAVIVAVAVTSCTATGPINVTVPATEAAVSCEVDPTNHVLAIDKRGNYSAIAFHGSGCNPEPRQPSPDNWRADGCAPPPIDHTGLSDEQYNDYVALDCHLNRIIQALTADPTHPQHLVIFVHGGLVKRNDALTRALQDIPLMQKHTTLDPAFMSGAAIFPLFYVWPSGFTDSYLDATINYAQGEYDMPLRRAGTPLYLATDLAETVSRAPLEIVKSMKRFSDAYLGTDDEPSDWGCRLDTAHFGCNYLGPWEHDYLKDAVYAATTPLRPVTTPIIETATSAWKNMVARTRFAFAKIRGPRRVCKDREYAQATEWGHAEGCLDHQTRHSYPRRPLFLFFANYPSKSPKNRDPQARQTLCALPLSATGMGEIVLNELMQNFPNLPYQNIVYMAAAGSIRDFKAMTERVLQHPRCGDLNFYNLSLHPTAEKRDLEVDGAAPVGSLLEWIDDIFEAPVTPIDRTLGKWQNILYAENQFDRQALPIMQVFIVSGWSTLTRLCMASSRARLTNGARMGRFVQQNTIGTLTFGRRSTLRPKKQVSRSAGASDCLHHIRMAQRRAAKPTVSRNALRSTGPSNRWHWPRSAELALLNALFTARRWIPVFAGVVTVGYGSNFPGLKRPAGSSAALMRRISSSSAPPRQSGIM